MDTSIYKIAQNLTYGRYLVASRNIKQGEVILKDKPTIVGPQIQAIHLCFKCSKHLQTSMKICKQCKVATVCSLDCDGTEHTANECRSLKETGLLPTDIITNPQIVMPLRCLLFRKYDTGKWSEIMQLESHLKERMHTEIWNTHQENVEQVLNDLGQLKKEDLKENTIQKICGILDVNTFELRPPNLNGLVANPSMCLRGLFLKGSLMTHDCIGNTLVSVDDDFLMTVLASVFIPAGEPIFFNYGNSLQGTYERRLRLKHGKYFDCICQRCSDPSELGTYLSSIKCQKCKIGHVVPSIPLSDTYKTDWNCESCGTIYKGILIKTTINEINNRIECLDLKSPMEAEKLLKKLYLTLAPQHYLILELKQNMIAMYERSLYTDNEMRRKIELCKDMINVLKIIVPGISRLQAIATYQLHATQVNMANKLYHSKQISPSKYLESLLEAETNLIEAAKFLVYEPLKSPEGRLAQQAINELKILRNMIKQLKLSEETVLPDKDNVLLHLMKNKCRIK